MICLSSYMYLSIYLNVWVARVDARIQKVLAIEEGQVFPLHVLMSRPEKNHLLHQDLAECASIPRIKTPLF